MSKDIKLYLYVSSVCNFECRHCISSSNPNVDKWTISDNECQNIANYVNHNKKIKIIDFTGGEPTLFLNKIKLIQKLISREDIKYHITTNASFKEIEKLSDIKIDHIVISFDKYHLEFINSETIEKYILSLKNAGYSIEINSVYSEIADIALLPVIKEKDIKLTISKIVTGGNRDQIDEMTSDSPYKFNCHALTGEYEKINYIPQKGMTPCCGPLMFDKLKSEDILFTQLSDQYNSNKLKEKLNAEQFKDFFDRFKINTKKLNLKSTCEVCSMIHKEICNDLTLEDFLKQTEQTKFYNSNQLLDIKTVQIINQLFHVRYFYTLDLKSIHQEICSHKLPDSITINTETNKISDILEFMIESYYQKFLDYYDHDDIKKFKDISSLYQSANPLVYRYYKLDKLVATLMFNIYDPHPVTNKRSIHIGYWGYKKELVDKNEAKGILSSWFNILKENLDDESFIDASVDYFNVSGMNLMKKAGFKHLYFRLDKRPSP